MFRVGSRHLLSLVFLAAALVLVGRASAQADKPSAVSAPAGDQNSAATGAQTQPTDEVDPLKRAPSEKQKKQQKRNLNIELSKTYKKWLNEDVAYIITAEERAAFKA